MWIELCLTAGLWTTPPPAALAAAAAADDSLTVPAARATVPVPRRTPPPLVPLKDLHHAVGTFITDGWHVASAPSRMHRKDALELGAAVGIAAVLYANDDVIMRQFQRNRGNNVYDAVLWPGRKVEKIGNMGNTLRYYFAGMAVGYAFRIEPLRELTSEIIESHFISGGIRNVAEQGFGRFRPFEGEGPYHFDPGHGSSFPSGHASVIIELATITSRHARSTPVTVAAYAIAGSALMERVDSRSHWPSDVFTGATFGYFVSREVVRLHAERHAELHPMFGMRDGVPTWGMALKF